MMGSLAALNNSACEPFVWKPRFLNRTAVHFYPSFIASAWAQIVENVNEAESGLSS